MKWKWEISFHFTSFSTSFHSLRHGPEVGGGGFAQAIQVVAAFQEGHDSAVGVVGSDFFHQACEFDEVVVREGESTEGIVDAGIEAGGDQNEFRFELFGGFEQARFK